MSAKPCSTTASRAGSTTAVSQPARPGGTGDSGESTGREPVRRATWSWVTRWTSIAPASEAIRSPVVPGSRRRSRPCRETPTTIMVALAPAAKSTTAAGTSSPTTEWKVPPREATSSCGPVEAALVGAPEPVGGDDVHGEQLGAGGALGQPGAAPDQRLALGAAGDRDDDPLLGRPRLLDPVRAAVVVELVVDPVGQPQQRQLAQRGEVADPEVRRERGVDVLGLVDVAVRHPPAQRVRGHVDQLDLVGRAHHVVGHRLALADAGDPLDLVVERLQVLDVDGGDHVDPGGEELGDVVRPLLVAAAGTLVCASSSTSTTAGPAPGSPRCPSR